MTDAARLAATTHAGWPRQWRLPFALLLGCLAWTTFWYRDTALAMVSIWYRSETFAHAFIVPPISLWLIWRQRRLLASMSPRPSPWIQPLLLLVGLGWLVGQLTAVNALTQLAFVTSLVLTVPAVLGLRVAAAIAFPLAFMFFSVPIGDFAMHRMMDWTAEFTVIALRLTGIPVYQEGLQFIIPSGRWSVVEACSGVRYMIASLTVGTLFAYLTYTSYRRRIIFIGVSILVPLIANWVRAYMIVMLGHLSGNTLAVGVDHLIYGWLFFGVVIMLMFMIGARWAEVESDANVASPVPAFSGDARWSAAVIAGVLLVPLAVALPQFAFRTIESGNVGAPPQLRFPASIEGVGGWRKIEPPAIDWRPAWINPAAETTAWFQNGERVVGIYIGYYRNQTYDSKLVSSENVLVRSQDPAWAQVRSGSRAADLDGRRIDVATAELRRGEVSGSGFEKRLVVWRWYWINGSISARDIFAKAYSAWSQLTGAGDESAVVIVFTPKTPGDEADATIAAFLADAAAPIDAALRQTSRDGR